jgi:hypothetical protein
MARKNPRAFVRAECATRALKDARRRKVDAIVAPALRIVEPDKGSPAVASGATDGKAGGQGARAVPHPRLSYGCARGIVCPLSDSVQFIFRLAAHPFIAPPASPHYAASIAILHASKYRRSPAPTRPQPTGSHGEQRVSRATAALTVERRSDSGRA